GADGWSVEGEEASPLEDAIDDGLRQVLVMEDAPPGADWLVRGEDHRALPTMPVVDYVEEHVRRIGTVGEIPDFVDDEHSGVRVGRQSFGETSLAKGRRQVVDHLGGGGEVRVESVLDRAV